MLDILLVALGIWLTASLFLFTLWLFATLLMLLGLAAESKKDQYSESTMRSFRRMRRVGTNCAIPLGHATKAVAFPLWIMLKWAALPKQKPPKK